MTASILRAVLSAAVLFTFATPDAAHASSRPDPEQLLAALAAQQTHGWGTIRQGLSYDQMEAKLAAGERIYVPCGVVAILAHRLMARHGIPSRLVGAFANSRGDMYDVPADTLESHAMIEVWEGGRWVVYDLDSNVKAVDADGQGAGIRAFAAGPRQYRRLTDPAVDPAYSPDQSPYPIYEQWLTDNHEAWYQRVLGTVAVMPPGSAIFYFTDPTLKRTLDPMGGYEWVDADRWQRIVDAGPLPKVPAKPTLPIASIQPATPVTLRTSPPVTEAAKGRQGCRLRRRAVYRRRVSCRAAQRTLRRYLRSAHAPRGWTCRTRARVACVRNGRLVSVRSLRTT